MKRETEAEWFARLCREYDRDPEYIAHGIAYVLTDLICRECAGRNPLRLLVQRTGKPWHEVRAFLDFEDARTLTLGEIAEYLVAAGIADLRIEVERRMKELAEDA